MSTTKIIDDLIGTNIREKIDDVFDKTTAGYNPNADVPKADKPKSTPVSVSGEDLVRVAKDKDDYYNGLLDEKDAEIARLNQMLVDLGKERDSEKQRADTATETYAKLLESRWNAGHVEKKKEPEPELNPIDEFLRKGNTRR